MGDSTYVPFQHTEWHFTMRKALAQFLKKSEIPKLTPSRTTTHPLFFWGPLGASASVRQSDEMGEVSTIDTQKRYHSPCHTSKAGFWWVWVQSHGIVEFHGICIGRACWCSSIRTKTRSPHPAYLQQVSLHPLLDLVSQTGQP